MARLHLFEFHDYAWCPAVIRNGITECLRLFGERLALERVVAPVVRQILAETRCGRIVDVCSGSSGVTVRLARLLAAEGLDIEVLLTDKYPNREAFAKAETAGQGRVRGIATPVDATAIPPEMTGLRTLFNGFHHFRPEQAEAILRDAWASGQPIAIFEVTSRSFNRVLWSFPGSILLMLGAVPFMRTGRMASALLTYALPVLPLAFAWDGLCSCLRCYTQAELQEFTRGMGAGWHWRTGTLGIAGTPFSVTYFAGVPDKSRRISDFLGLYRALESETTASAAGSGDRLPSLSRERP